MSYTHEIPIGKNVTAVVSKPGYLILDAGVSKTINITNMRTNRTELVNMIPADKKIIINSVRGRTVYIRTDGGNPYSETVMEDITSQSSVYIDNQLVTVPVEMNADGFKHRVVVSCPGYVTKDVEVYYNTFFKNPAQSSSDYLDTFKGYATINVNIPGVHNGLCEYFVTKNGVQYLSGMFEIDETAQFIIKDGNSPAIYGNSEVRVHLRRGGTYDVTKTLYSEDITFNIGD